MNGIEVQGYFDNDGTLADGKEWFSSFNEISSHDHFLNFGSLQRQNPSNDNFINAKIDDIEVYSIDLGEDQIYQLYANYHAPDTLIGFDLINEVSLAWSSERIENIDKYYIYRDNILIDSVIVNSSTDTTYIDNDVLSETTYDYFIRSVDIFGNVSIAGDTVSVFVRDPLFAFYKLDGNAADSSSNKNDGTVFEAISTANRFNSANLAMSFDGVDDYITVPHSTALEVFDEDFTISLWFNKSELTSNAVLLRKAAASDTGFELKVTSDSLLLDLNHLGTPTRYVGTISVDSLKWQHVVILRESRCT